MIVLSDAVPYGRERRYRRCDQMRKDRIRVFDMYNHLTASLLPDPSGLQPLRCLGGSLARADGVLRVRARESGLNRGAEIGCNSASRTRPPRDIELGGSSPVSRPAGVSLPFLSRRGRLRVDLWPGNAEPLPRAWISTRLRERLTVEIVE